MKLKIDKESFKKHLGNISKGIVSYSPLFALKGILIEATKSNLVMVSSDGLLSFKEEIPNNQGIIIEEPGRVLVPGKTFKEVVERMEKTIAISTDGSKMILVSEATRTEINLLVVEEYPRISFEPFGKDLVVGADVLKNMVRNVAFAAATEDKRVVLNGVNIKAKDGGLVLTATDTFRLSSERVAIDSQVDFDITVMSKKIKDFLPAEATGTIKINVDENKIISKIGQTTIMSRVIDGVYPQLEKLVANEFSSTIQVEVRDLEKNIDRVILVAESGKGVIQLDCNKTELSLESKKSELGASLSRVESFELKGDPVKIAFDYSFLREAITKFTGKVEIAFNGPQKPFIIRGDSNRNLTQLIMPHRSF